MLLSWILTILTSAFLGIVVTIVVQYYLFVKHFVQQDVVTVEKKTKSEPFQLPKVLLDVIHCNQLVTKESCVALNLLLQFLFHELRDTEKIRLWFRDKLCLEFEELLSRSAIGRMVASIRIIEIDLGSEFPVINNVLIDDVKVNNDYSHIDTLDLKLDVNYSGGFRLVVEANMLLGKAALISIKVNELYGEGRLEFTRLPYSHWSFTFINDPKIQLHVESHFKGRPFHQITNFISNQIKKSLKKKHTLPNYKIRYKPFFSASEGTTQVGAVTPGHVQMIIHKLSRLNEMAPENSEIYCVAGLDTIPWIEIVNYGKNNYYLTDVVITKKIHEVFNYVFRQEFVEDKNQICVILEDAKSTSLSSHENLCRDDIIVSIDGKKVSTASQALKLIKSAAFQFTVRVERKVRNRILEENSNDNVDPLSSNFPAPVFGVRKRKVSESESSSSSATPSVSGSPGGKMQIKRVPPSADAGKTSIITQKSGFVEESESFLKLLKSKVRPNRQIVLYDEYFTLQVRGDEKFLNINVRYKENDSSKDKLLGFVNIPLLEVQNATDTLKCLKLKPPDSFAASNIRNHKLLNHNGFIPLLCYGDILLTLQFYPTSDAAFKFVPEIIEPNLTPESEIPPVLLPEGKKHEFIKTHFQTSIQCEFCGRKIWMKDAEKCRDCGMTCHKKCVVKCLTATICVPRAETTGGNFTGDDDVLRRVLDTDGGTSSRESTPQPTPTKKRFGNLLATVASAGRGLKRVGSANNLSLPGDASQSSQSRSLPPSPQQSPAPSRKASLPVELIEEIAPLLHSLMEQELDKEDMMELAKETGKSLYEDLVLMERKDKINEMINKLNVAISAEDELRMNLMKEDELEKDPTNKTKIAFLIGKSDEKSHALQILMLHFCAGMQHIQDLEDQEKENDMIVREIGVKTATSNTFSE